jgi:hypothetical protein
MARWAYVTYNKNQSKSLPSAFFLIADIMSAAFPPLFQDIHEVRLRILEEKTRMMGDRISTIIDILGKHEHDIGEVEDCFKSFCLNHDELEREKLSSEERTLLEGE